MARQPVSAAERIREAWFWTGVFRDHTLFIHDNLAPDQAREVKWARDFQQTFQKLEGQAASLARAAGIPAPAGSYALSGRPKEAPLAQFDGQELVRYETQSQELARSTLDTLSSLRAFKEQLLQQKLDCKVTLGLGPVLIAHMIVEAEEGHRALSSAREAAEMPPALEALHHHLIWLPDAAGHAVALNNGLDGVEQKLRLKTENFHQIFSGMHVKAMELYSMLRIAPRMVGVLQRLNRDSVAQIGVFVKFLEDLREHLEGCEILGTLVPDLAEHMLKEELYYTEKIMAIRG